MALERAWAINQFTFNSATYDDTNGGPLDWDFADDSNEIGSKVADQVYSSAILIPERDLQVTIALRDPYIAITPGTKSNLALTITVDDSDTTILTFADMVYLHQRAGGQKSIEAQSTLVFRYEGTGTSRITRL